MPRGCGGHTALRPGSGVATAGRSRRRHGPHRRRRARRRRKVTTGSISGCCPAAGCSGAACAVRASVPWVVEAPGFTLRRRLQGQLQLDFLPPGPHERCRPTDPVRRSGLRRRAGYYASADFCAAVTGLADPLSPGFPDTAQTSRGKTDRLRRIPAGFATPAVDGCGLRDFTLARPAG